MRSHVPLMFPSTRKALWCHMPLGGPVTLIFPRISLSVTEQVLYLAFGQSRSGKSEHCRLCGDIKVEPDCSEVVLYLDQFVSSVDNNEDSNIPGAFQVPTKLCRKSRHDMRLDVNCQQVEDTHWQLTDRAKSAGRVELAEFLTATADCTVFGGSNQIHCDLDVDVMTLGAKFDITPIESVSMAMTALSKSVLGNDKNGIINNQVKSGYLTMDQYRKVVFLLESDPKVLTVPIIGIWASGIELVTDPYIWACCVRYMHTPQISDRVPKPSEPFLLIHKSPLMTSAQCFDCIPASSALNFRMMSGSQGFSMAKDANGVRKGLLSVKLEMQDLKTPRGRRFAELVEETAVRHEQENRMIHATPKPTKQLHSSGVLDDSMPRSSPSAYRPVGMSMTPTVPEVSVLDESNPLEAPRPERLAIHQTNDHRLNRSPFKTVNQVIYQPQKPDQAARKIKFDENEAENTHNIIQKMLSKPITPSKPSTTSLRSPHPSNTQPTGLRPASRHTPNTLTTTEALNLSIAPDEKSPNVAKLTPFSKSSSSKKRIGKKLQMPPQPQFQWPHMNSGAPAFPSTMNQGYPPAPPAPHQPLQQPYNPIPPLHYGFPVDYSQPYATVMPRTQPPLHQTPSACQCQCQHHVPYHQPGYAATSASVPPTNPLSIITDNVQRLLSPRASTQRQPVPVSDQSNPPQFDKVNISPIDNTGQSKVPCTPSPLSQQSQISNNMSPEVQEILKQQDNQLKALQQQIQKLLKAQERRDQQGNETLPLPAKKCATVNTGMSLLETGNHAPSQMADCGMSDTHGSIGDSSSQSHSLIQHDLTTLDLPTQVTALSFSSDINVDYESYDDSPTSSPKRDGSHDSRSDESWQSPVLGESVSMIAESMGQESTKQQLDVIIKNVRDLLSKHTPVKTLPTDLSRLQNETTPQPALSELPPPPGDEMEESSSASGPSTKTKKHAEAKDVALATRTQLRKMGIEVETPARLPTSNKPDCLPRLQYISMVMTDSSMADSNKSLEMNALALKYLQDDQLTELAQYTVYKQIDSRHSETSLLRQVLTMSKPPATISSSVNTTIAENNMSMATQQYLRRYALTDTSINYSGLSYDETPALDVTDPEPALHLKSILRKSASTLDHKPQLMTEEQTESSQDSSIQVLDIARLKELPKLL